MLTFARFFGRRPVARAAALCYHMTSSTQEFEPDITDIVGGVSKWRPFELCRTVGQVL